MKTETTTQLSESEVNEIEARLSVEYEHDIAPHNRMLADLHALIRDWRALRAIVGDPQKWMRWCDIQVLEANEALVTENAALREQLADTQQNFTRRTEQLALAEQEVRGVLAVLGSDAIHSRPEGGTEDIYESLAISVAKLQSRLAQVTKERDEAEQDTVQRELEQAHASGSDRVWDETVVRLRDEGLIR